MAAGIQAADDAELVMIGPSAGRPSGRNVVGERSPVWGKAWRGPPMEGSALRSGPAPRPTGIWADEPRRSYVSSGNFYVSSGNDARHMPTVLAVRRLGLRAGSSNHLGTTPGSSSRTEKGHTCDRSSARWWRDPPLPRSQ